MTTYLDAYPVTFTCDKCHHDFTKTVGELKTNIETVCPDCGATYDGEDVRAQLLAAEKCVADFANDIGTLGKK